MLIAIYIALTFFQPGLVFDFLSDARPMLILSVIVGMCALFSHSVDKQVILQHPITRFLLFFVMIQAVSVYPAGGMAIINEFMFWYIFVMFVLIVTFLINSLEKLKQAIWGLLFGASYVVGYGIYAVYNQLPSSLAIGGRAGAYGMYANHNDYTFLIILIFPFIVKYLLTEQGLLKKILLTTMAIGSTWGMMLSQSRGGIVAFACEIIFFGWFFTNKKLRMIIIPLLMIISLGGIYYQISARDAASGGYDTARAKYLRVELWRTGFKMLKAHPLLGVGSRRFEEASPGYTDLTHSNVGLNSHNTIIQVLATSGLLGFIGFAGMLGASIKVLVEKQINDLPPSFQDLRDTLFIALVALTLRSLLDAKPHEFGFYVLAAFILTYSMLLKREIIYAQH